MDPAEPWEEKQEVIKVSRRPGWGSGARDGEVGGSAEKPNGGMVPQASQNVLRTRHSGDELHPRRERQTRRMRQEIISGTK